MPIQNVTPILNVSSVADSMVWLERLGWKGGFSWPEGNATPDFGSVCSERAEIFLCRGAQGSRGSIIPRFARRCDGRCVDELVGEFTRGGGRTPPDGALARHDRHAPADKRSVGRARVSSPPSRRTHVPRECRTGRRLISVFASRVHGHTVPSIGRSARLRYASRTE